MRVLFITGEFPPMQGGVGDCTNEIALALAKRGVQVSVLTTVGVATNGTRYATGGTSVLRPPSSALAPPSSVLNVLRIVPKWDWSALALIRRALAETQADIYHIQYQTAAFGMHPMINFAPRLIPIFAGRSETGAGVKSVVTFHDLRPMYLFPKAGRVRDWVTFQLARTTDAVIATNKEDYDRLEPLNLNELGLIPIGSNIDPTPPADFDRDALRAQLGVRPGEILLSYFGFLNESKGGETLIRALAELSETKLLMLGGQTGASDETNIAYLAHVKKIISEAGLGGRVLWSDFMPQSQITAHLLASDVCVLPYRDGASYRRGTFMAALAHGRAIVTTGTPAGERTPAPTGMDSALPQNVVSLPLLRNGENVFLVPPDDPHAIAGAVKRIAASPELRIRLERGAQETAQFFTWDKIAGAHLEFYNTLLKK